MMNYLKEKIPRIGFDIVCVFVFALVFKLSDVPTKVALYPAMICATFWLMYVLFDLRKYLIRHKELQQHKNNIDITLHQLQSPKTQMESDYQELLCQLEYVLLQRLRDVNKVNFDNREFITTWAHQIKTPITAINLLLQDMDEENELDKSYTREMKNQLFEIEQYVDMMLQYIRLDSLNSDLVLQQYNLLQIVKQAVKYFSRVFIGRNISLKLDDNLNEKVVTDEKWILFVLKQILSNSLKYTKKGTISIYLKKQNKTLKGQNSLILVIEDTGVGICSEDLPRIFQRGFTGYNGRMEKKSTGIGLYLTKTILDRLNNGINIYSQVNKGTQVEIIFRNLTNM
ncbi:hypothetical protein SAMN02745248_02160 [Hathewaya proteolytica DSM 3090]|uniref:histidine kinase n=1 Tax=Hathewaya proteolytica DSM 3090 TaxID=1121331 RepID=A0A1M6QYN1_9CLOT|nr:sensor histidine kinase [Hathewaya proteolytica]SHK25263.1 hypothetical protein SAMN02745248_02160 [Hathewaya proteolytica DSM 3090]